MEQKYQCELGIMALGILELGIIALGNNVERHLLLTCFLRNKKRLLLVTETALRIICMYWSYRIISIVFAFTFLFIFETWSNMNNFKFNWTVVWFKVRLARKFYEEFHCQPALFSQPSCNFA